MILTTKTTTKARKRTRPPVHPGRILRKHYLFPLGLSISHAARGLQVSRKTLSAIVNERSPVSPLMALKLARAFGTSPELWVNLQQNYDLFFLAKEHKEIEDVIHFIAAPA